MVEKNNSKTIAIGIANDFIRQTYAEVFQQEGYNVLAEKDGEKLFDSAQEILPEVIIADVNLEKIGGLDFLKKAKQNPQLRVIPIIIFTEIERADCREKAIELEARDFFVGTRITPLEVLRRIKIILGEQKSYMVAIQKNLYDAKELITDLGYSYDFKCPKCGSDLVIHLIRDLSKGENSFLLSVICPRCKE